MVCCGVQVLLRASASAGLALLQSALPRAARPSRATQAVATYSLVLGGPGPLGGSARSHVLYRNEVRIGRSRNLDDIRRAFGRDLGALIGEHAPRRVFVHAGVVGFGDGAVLVPGKSLSGKTTLTRALVEAGGTYYSDEFAVLDSRGRVLPWAEPLSIRRAGSGNAGESHSAESLGLKMGRRSIPILMVVLTQYEPGGRFRPWPLARGPAILAVLQHTLSARRRPRATLNALTAALAGASVIAGTRDEACETAKIIVRRLARLEVPKQTSLTDRSGPRPGSALQPATVRAERRSGLGRNGA